MYWAMNPHLPWSTFCPIKRWTFLRTVEWIVVVAAPQLFTRVKDRVLETHRNRICQIANHREITERKRNIHSNGETKKWRYVSKPHRTSDPDLFNLSQKGNNELDWIRDQYLAQGPLEIWSAGAGDWITIPLKGAQSLCLNIQLHFSFLYSIHLLLRTTYPIGTTIHTYGTFVLHIFWTMGGHFNVCRNPHQHGQNLQTPQRRPQVKIPSLNLLDMRLTTTPPSCNPSP